MLSCRHYLLYFVAAHIFPTLSRSHAKSTRIIFDRGKHARTLTEWSLHFADAAQVFAGLHATLPDTRRDHGEPRFITAGRLGTRLMVMVWTPRGTARRIISMRHAHAEEEARWRQHLG
jgi:uncharacterized protein